MSKRPYLAILIIAAASFPGFARADGPSAAAAAQAAFDQGRKLEDAGDYAGAAARFEESERLDPALGTILNLATCYERAGRFASAWRAYERGVAEARATGEEKRAQRAQQLADAVKARLSSLAIEAPEDLPADAAVRVDGAALDRAQWRVPAPIDGGKHRIDVHASGRKDWSTEVDVAQSAQQAVVKVPALEAAPIESAPVPEATSATPASVAPTAPPPPHWTAPRVTGAALAGVGIVALGAGAVFGLQARAHWSDREAQCAFDRCSPAGYQAGEDAKSAALRANIAFIAGGAAVVTGAVLYFAVPGLASKPAQIGAAPMAGGGSAVVSGSF